MNPLLAAIARAGDDLNGLKAALDEIAAAIAALPLEEQHSQTRAQWRNLIDEMAEVVLAADESFHA